MCLEWAVFKEHIAADRQSLTPDRNVKNLTTELETDRRRFDDVEFTQMLKVVWTNLAKYSKRFKRFRTAVG